MTAGLKEAFDTEEIDEEYLNDETEDPLDRLHLARSKLASAQKVIQSHSLHCDGGQGKAKVHV